MSEQTKRYILHVFLGGLGASLAALSTSASSGKLDQSDFIAAMAVFVAYLSGAIQRSPADVRNPGAQTRATDQ